MSAAVGVRRDAVFVALFTFLCTTCICVTGDSVCRVSSLSAIQKLNLLFMTLQCGHRERSTSESSV